MQKLENKNRTVDIFHLSKQEMHENILFLFNSLGDVQIFFSFFFFNTLQHGDKSPVMHSWRAAPCRDVAPARGSRRTETGPRARAPVRVAS